MNECWINVYDDYDIGHTYQTRADAIFTSKLMLEGFKAKTLYRIHVRLK